MSADLVFETRPGYCLCGCGDLTALARATNARIGIRKGQPNRFVAGHYSTYRARVAAAVRDESYFWPKVNRAPGNACWEWTGATRKGYGTFQSTQWGKTIHRLAHRHAYELLVGPIPEGLTIDHLCRNTLCVNPAHLEPVTGEENRNRGSRSPLNTTCINGHAYTPENTYRYKNRRECRTCRRLAGMRQYYRQQQKVAS